MSASCFRNSFILTTCTELSEIFFSESKIACNLLGDTFGNKQKHFIGSNLQAIDLIQMFLETNAFLFSKIALIIFIVHKFLRIFFLILLLFIRNPILFTGAKDTRYTLCAPWCLFAANTCHSIRFELNIARASHVTGSCSRRHSNMKPAFDIHLNGNLEAAFYCN